MEDEIPKHKRKKKKTFAIEYRVVPGHPLGRIPPFAEYHTHKKYETREDMLKALNELQSRDQNLFEYREKNSEN
jgi:hypothetical protein